MSKKDNKLFLIFFCIILATILIAVNSMNSFLYKFNQSTDVHCFVTTARCMLRGDVLYKDVYEHKGPILYFLYVIGLLISPHNFVGIAFVETIFYAVYIFFMYKITELFVDNKSVRYILTLLAALISCCDTSFDGGGQCEELTLPFLCITIYIVLRYFKKEYPNKIKALDIIIIGGCFSMVFWMKYSLTGLYIGLVLFILIYQIKDKTMKNLWIYMLQFLAGFLIGSLPIIIYYLINGGVMYLFEVYFYSVIFKYGEAGGDRINIFDFFLNDGFLNMHMANACCYIAVILYLFGRKQKHFDRNVKAVLATMLLTQLLGLTISYNRHYMAQAACLFSILGVLVIYFMVYDCKGKLRYVIEKIITLITNILTKNYAQVGWYAIFIALLVLVIDYKKVFLLAQFAVSVLFARVLLKLENIIYNKCNKVVFLKYVFVVLVYITKYKYLKNIIMITYLMLLIYDWSCHKQKVLEFFGEVKVSVQAKAKRRVYEVAAYVIGILAVIVIALNASPYSWHMTEEKESYPQYVMAQYIKEDGLDNPQIIYWDCFDNGVYWLTGTYPPYRYFCQYELKSEFIPRLFKSGMDSGKIDYVVSANLIQDDNFEQVYHGEREYENIYTRQYYLYRRKDIKTR